MARLLKKKAEYLSAANKNKESAVILTGLSRLSSSVFP